MDFLVGDIVRTVDKEEYLRRALLNNTDCSDYSQEYFDAICGKIVTIEKISKVVSTNGSYVQSVYTVEKIEGIGGDWTYHIPLWCIDHYDNNIELSNEGFMSLF